MPLFQKAGQKALRPSLDNIRYLCRELSHPEQQFASIHIAGTNGKGSVAAMLAAILTRAGYKTGLFTSPHILDYRERIRIDGTCIPKAAVVEGITTLRPALDKILPSFFEVTTALAIWHFAHKQVDWAVIETGLGGTWDSTNVLQPQLSVITNIGLDHMAILGPDLPTIAGEKAGIIKEGIPVVIGETNPETELVFRKIAEARGAPLIFADQVIQTSQAYHSSQTNQTVQSSQTSQALHLSQTNQAIQSDQTSKPIKTSQAAQSSKKIQAVPPDQTNQAIQQDQANPTSQTNQKTKVIPDKQNNKSKTGLKGQELQLIRTPDTFPWGNHFELDLSGDFQRQNATTALTALWVLNQQASKRDLNQQALKRDLNQQTSKGDLNQQTTKEDLNQQALKRDINQQTSKGDLNQQTSKGDLNQQTTKGDLNQQASNRDLNQQASKRGHPQKATRFPSAFKKPIQKAHVREGLARTTSLTGLRGRMEFHPGPPAILLDVGHNEPAVSALMETVQHVGFPKLYIVWGMMKDKAIPEVLGLLPTQADYYLTQSDSPRAITADKLEKLAIAKQLKTKTFNRVEAALEAAWKEARNHNSEESLILVGGSAFIVAEAIETLQKANKIPPPTSMTTNNQN